MNRFIEKVRVEFAYLSYAPIVFVSAKSGQRVDTILPEVDRVYENSNRRIAQSWILWMIRKVKILCLQSLYSVMVPILQNLCWKTQRLQSLVEQVML